LDCVFVCKVVCVFVVRETKNTCKESSLADKKGFENHEF